MKKIILLSLFIGTLLLLACRTTAITSTPISAQIPTPRLQLLSLTDQRQYGYITVSGEVKNISPVNLNDVTVVVSFYAENEVFVKADQALITYNPVLINQISPFEAMATDNPAITKYKVSFKEFMGGSISHEDKRGVSPK